MSKKNEKVEVTGPALFGEIEQIIEFVNRIKGNENGYTVDELLAGLLYTSDRGYYLKSETIKKKKKFVKVPKKTFKQMVSFLENELEYNIEKRDEVKRHLKKVQK